MPLLTLRPTEEGVARLMWALRDVQEAPDRDTPDRPVAGGSPRHVQLFHAYRQLLGQALREAEPWWEGTVAAQEGRGLDRKEAIAAAFDARYAGPASYPRVAWIVRFAWLECAWINDQGDAALRIRPENLLLGWLVEAGETELVRLIACMPYWPVGLDAEGNWC